MHYLDSQAPNSPVINRERFKGYPEHVHENLELVLIESGTREVYIRGKKYTEPPGSLTVVFPFLPHSYPDSPDAVYAWVGVSPRFLPGIEELLGYVPESPVIEAGRLGRHTVLVEYLFGCPRDTRAATLNALAAALVSELSEELSLKKREFSSVGCEVLPVLAAHCRENDFSLEALSKLTGIAARELAGFFRVSFGMTFGAFLRKYRLDNAISMLAMRGKSITEIAFESGFSSVRTFNRVFREEFGISPSEYRR